MTSDGTFFGLASLVDLIAQFSYLLFLYRLKKTPFALYFSYPSFEMKEFVISFLKHFCTFFIT